MKAAASAAPRRGNSNTMASKAELTLNYRGAAYPIPPEVSVRLAKQAREWKVSVPVAAARILKKVEHVGNGFFCLPSASTCKHRKEKR